MSYTIGDVVNGYVLGEDHEWHAVRGRPHPDWYYEKPRWERGLVQVCWALEYCWKHNNWPSAT